MGNKKVISYYMEFNSMFFQKENMLKPMLLSKALGCDCEIYYGQNTDSVKLPTEYEGVKLICQNYKGQGIMQLLKVVWLLIKQSRNIKNLMTFHTGRNIALLTIFIKFLNPKVSVWVSGDIEIGYAYKEISDLLNRKPGIKGLFNYYLYKYFFKKLDIFSVETLKVYNCLKPLFEEHGLNNLVYLPCGIDKEQLNQLILPDEKKKENLIISVGRFGPPQKNTEMLLDGLAKVELRDWKVLLVGPITDDFSLRNSSEFQNYIDSFFFHNPQVKDRVIFTGPIFDPRTLNELFSKAKIFVMTSRHEAFANVFAQARWYQCHILSTDVGGAQDMSNDWEYGTCVEQENPDDLADKMQKLIDGDIVYPPIEFAQGISYQDLIENIIKPRIE